MTIKQQGGIFGRNPTFNDLTVEGTFTTSGAQTMEELNVDNVNIDGNTISVTDTNGNLTLSANGTGSIRSNYDLLLGNTVTNPASNFADQEGFGWDYSSNKLEVSSDGIPVILGRTSTGGDGIVLEIKQAANSAGNIRVEGNAAYFTVKNGGGIDFSATAGTGTSELFDDYEEGTWTPVIAGNTVAGSNTYTVQNGYYTKIGNRVLINLDIAMSNKDAAMDGTVIITGLPFTPSTATNNAASMAFGRYDNVNLSAGYTQLVAMVQSNGTFLPREVGDNVAAQIIDDAAMSNTSRFQLSGHYFV